MKLTKNLVWLLSIVTVVALSLPAQANDGDASLSDVARSAEKDLEESLAELTALRQQIAREKLPLNQRLRELEDRLVAVRGEFDTVSRDLDRGNLDLNNLRTDLKSRGDEGAYLGNLLDEYVRNLETRIHIAELQRYREAFEDARDATDSADRSAAEVYTAQVEMVETSLDRLLDDLGGTIFPGQAIGPDGTVHDVEFAVVGPVAMYRSIDGTRAGLAEQRIGSLEPNMIPMDDASFVAEVSSVIGKNAGLMPFDATLGNAQKVEATQDTIPEHIAKGGVVMIPILILAASSLFVALLKWFQLARVRVPSKKKIAAVLDAVRARDTKMAGELATDLKGPSGEMVRAGLEHLTEPKTLIEEVMFEKMLDTRLRLNSFLSFVAVCAAAAPLLGLLGTVTGIINTFKLITVFGTGDAKTLSSGISEALITTEFGLIIAIPSLLLHAFLSRKARRLIDGMEKTAVALLNRIIPGSGGRAPGGSETPDDGGSVDVSRPRVARPAGLTPQWATASSSASAPPAEVLDH